MEPAKALMRIPLPTEGGGLGLTPPGPSVLEVFSENGVSSGRETVAGKQLSMFIGNTIWMKKMIVTSVEPTFSAETDEDDYPIWCKLKIDISSIYTATSNMVDTYFGFDTSSQER
jgi:hypothetical protein